jgi:hypothetical protein
MPTRTIEVLETVTDSDPYLGGVRSTGEAWSQLAETESFLKQWGAWQRRARYARTPEEQAAAVVPCDTLRDIELRKRLGLSACAEPPSAAEAEHVASATDHDG